MSSKKLAKKVLITTLSASMVLPFGSAVYANTQALPNGTIVTENGVGYLKDSNGEKYSGWFFDSNDEWYYFNETNKAMKKGWHHDDKDGCWYYLNSSNGKMATGWQKIDGKEYFFQSVRDMGNYHFNNEQEKWLYSMNSKVPYGAMYVSTTTPDGFKVDGSGAKVAEETAAQSGNTNASSGTQTTKNGWVSENGSWHYYENGAMAKDKWLNVSGKWYYVVSDGSMVTGTWKEIGGKSYYFGADGAMYVNTTTPDGNKVDSNGVKVVASTNLVNVANFVGVFVPYDGITGNSGVKIQSISGGRISGKAVTDDDAFSEFDVPLSGNKFTITYKIADIEWEDAKDEVISWNGIRGTYTKTYELVIKNGVPALIDGTLKEYDMREVPEQMYLEKSDSSYDDSWISSWYSELSGEYWNKGKTNASSGAQTTKNGWVSENGSWHYYENGTLAKNKWLNVSGKWYYVVSDGSMVSGTWKEIGGKSYYFGTDGAMYANTTTPDGKQVDGNGNVVVESHKMYPSKSTIVGTYVYDEGKEGGYYDGEIHYNHVYTLYLNEDNTYGYVYDNSMRVYNTEGTYIYNEETGIITFSGDGLTKGIVKDEGILIPEEGDILLVSTTSQNNNTSNSRHR